MSGADVAHPIVQRAIDAAEGERTLCHRLQSHKIEQHIRGPVVAHRCDQDACIHERQRVLGEVLPQTRIGHRHARIAGEDLMRIEAALDEPLGNLAEQEDLADTRRGMDVVRSLLLDHYAVGIHEAEGPDHGHGRSLGRRHDRPVSEPGSASHDRITPLGRGLDHSRSRQAR